MFDKKKNKKQLGQLDKKLIDDLNEKHSLEGFLKPESAVKEGEVKCPKCNEGMLKKVKPGVKLDGMLLYECEFCLERRYL